MPPGATARQTHKDSFWNLAVRFRFRLNRGLAEPAALSILIGLDYVTETILGSPVTAISIGVIDLHKLFIARLYVFTSWLLRQARAYPVLSTPDRLELADMDRASLKTLLGSPESVLICAATQRDFEKSGGSSWR